MLDTFDQNLWNKTLFSSSFISFAHLTGGCNDLRLASRHRGDDIVIDNRDDIRQSFRNYECTEEKRKRMRKREKGGEDRDNTTEINLRVIDRPA